MSIEMLETAPRASEFRYFCKVFFSRSVVVFGAIIAILFLVTAIFAPVLAPYDPYEPDLNNTLANPSMSHLLGTDSLGRDTLSRVIYGAQTSLIVGLITVSLASVIGMSLGLIAGFFGGWISMIIMRFVDALMCFPMILLALVVAALLGGGMKNVVIALTVGLVPIFARIMHGQVLTVKENDYILAERSMAAGNLRIMISHLIPNCFPPLIVLITMMMGTTILAEAGLSFLGIGIEAPTAAWGSMINEGRQKLMEEPILSFAPGLAMMLVVFSLSMLGDGLRDALDPRLRGLI
jgi:ABC-type dipeptide/oligopeptide/nickel transport system permease subunit